MLIALDACAALLRTRLLEICGPRYLPCDLRCVSGLVVSTWCGPCYLSLSASSALCGRDTFRNRHIRLLRPILSLSCFCAYLERKVGRLVHVGLCTGSSMAQRTRSEPSKSHSYHARSHALAQSDICGGALYVRGVPRHRRKPFSVANPRDGGLTTATFPHRSPGTRRRFRGRGSGLPPLC